MLIPVDMNKNRWGTVNSRSRVRVKAPGVLRRQGKYPDEEGGWGGVFATWVYPLLPDMIPSHLVHTSASLRIPSSFRFETKRHV